MKRDGVSFFGIDSWLDFCRISLLLCISRAEGQILDPSWLAVHHRHNVEFLKAFDGVFCAGLGVGSL